MWPLTDDENFLKFIYSEKATKFCEISTLDLTVLHTVKSKVEILQNFVAFSEHMNFNWILFQFISLRITHKLSGFLVKNSCNKLKPNYGKLGNNSKQKYYFCMYFRPRPLYLNPRPIIETYFWSIQNKTWIEIKNMKIM